MVERPPGEARVLADAGVAKRQCQWPSFALPAASGASRCCSDATRGLRIILPGPGAPLERQAEESLCSIHSPILKSCLLYNRFGSPWGQLALFGGAVLGKLRVLSGHLMASSGC